MNHDSPLVKMAWEARGRAYAPYSGFAVGAALETADGSVFCGCNVENLSLGLTLCAERTCVCAAVAAGHRAFRRLVIVADTEVPISPCGACRQVLAEFSPHLEIWAFTSGGKSVGWTLDELLPRAAAGILNRPETEQVTAVAWVPATCHAGARRTKRRYQNAGGSA